MAGIRCFAVAAGAGLRRQPGACDGGGLCGRRPDSPGGPRPHHTEVAALVSLPEESVGLRGRLADIKAALTAPYRYLRLASITKKVVADAKKRFAGKGSKSATEGSAAKTLKAFLPGYIKNHVVARTSPEHYRSLLNTSLDLLIGSFTSSDPFVFKPYHEAIRRPDLDLYAWGNDFFRCMVKFQDSRLEGARVVNRIREHLRRGDNVVLLANHQTEADPQALSLILEQEGHGDLASQCIFVAGHKVTTDPLAVPFSKGRNLLTIFSKKYLDTFSDEEKEVKSARNRATLAEWQRLLNEGGKLFWVAPSGGRDRKNPETNKFQPAKFDSSSVGLFQILAQKSQKAGHKTRFFPLAMWTHELVPPPDEAKAGVGEQRSAARAPLGMEFGGEMDPEELGTKKEFPAIAERIVNEHYAHLDKLMRQ